MARALISLLLSALVLPSLLTGCNKNENVEEGNKVNLKTTIPLIDTHVPAGTETATFALG